MEYKYNAPTKLVWRLQIRLIRRSPADSDTFLFDFPCAGLVNSRLSWLWIDRVRFGGTMSFRSGSVRSARGGSYIQVPTVLQDLRSRWSSDVIHRRGEVTCDLWLISYLVTQLFTNKLLWKKYVIFFVKKKRKNHLAAVINEQLLYISSSKLCNVQYVWIVYNVKLRY